MNEAERSERLGGLFLMLGAASLPLIIIEYVMVTSGTPTDLSARMAYYEETHSTLARGWHFEVIAMALIGAGALVRLNSPGRAGWALAAIGVAAVLPMYPMMIGGYAAAYASGEIGPVNFELVNEMAKEIFYVGNLLTSAGIALALFLERKSATILVPKWLMWVGAIFNGIAGLGFLALHAGLPIQLAMLGPFGLIGFISLAAFGAFVAFRKRISG